MQPKVVTTASRSILSSSCAYGVVMSEQKRLKSLSVTTRKFLDAGEGQLVDFKRTPDGISADDLVAFANAAEGGTILAGVDEKTIDGSQIGILLGCSTSDNTILQLLNKAISCFPPVSIDVVIENLNDKPILRIVVPSSPTKPHCTPKGVYCRRDGSRNRALHPGELLSIFLESEGQTFAERFESAAATISEEINNLEESLANTIRSMSDQLGWAESNLDDTSSTIDTVLAYAKLIKNETDDTSSRLRALFRQDTREDPIRERERTKLVESLVEQISKSKKLTRAAVEGKSLSYTMKGKSALELTVEDGQAALDEAFKIIRDREDRKKYKARCMPPSECGGPKLDEIVALVAADENQAQTRKKIAKALVLGVSTYDEKVVAVAALRQPTLAERRKIFQQTGTNADAKAFKLQIDWVSLHPDHHNKSVLSRLVPKVLAQANDRAVFALVQGEDELTGPILERCKFQLVATASGASSTSVPVRLYLSDSG